MANWAALIEMTFAFSVVLGLGVFEFVTLRRGAKRRREPEARHRRET